MALFDFNGKNLYYEIHGEGKPLLLLNGIMMSTASWKEFIEPLSANNKLVLLDMLDQGKSDHMDGPFTQALQVEAVYAFIKEMHLDDLAIMGISYGGEVALQLCVKYPDACERLILFNTTACTGPWLGDIGDAWNLAKDNWEAYYLTTIPVIYSPKFYKDHNDWMNNRKKVLEPVFSDKVFIDAMVRLTNSAVDYDVRDRLGEIKVPTLVVSCQEDYLTPMAEQEIIAAGIPDAHRVIIPGSGHASMYEQPLLFASLILGFTNNCKTKYTIV